MLMWAVLVGTVGTTNAADLRGAGATFPFPLYAAWAEAYRRETGVAVGYLPVGSGSGLDQVTRRSVDFGGTDITLTEPELKSLRLLQFPVVIGGVVPVVNLSGIASGQLKLTGAVLASIYLGTVRKWNDAAIAGLNPDLELPDAYITVVHRSERSGTTRMWSEFLSASSDAWKTSIGTESEVAWPTGVGEAGNEGVASVVQRTRFSLGYVEYAYARQHGLAVASLRNRAGLFVLPSPEGFEAAAIESRVRLGLNGVQLPIDQEGPSAWPITGVSFVLLPDDAQERSRGAQVLRFFDWALRCQSQATVELGYATLPASAARGIAQTLAQFQATVSAQAPMTACRSPTSSAVEVAAPPGPRRGAGN